MYRWRKTLRSAECNHWNIISVYFVEIARVGEGKKIFQLEYISEEHLLVVVSGKQRHVRLVPIRALDGDETEWIKVAESKGCSVLTIGPVLRAPLTFCLCVAVKKQVSMNNTFIYLGAYVEAWF